MTPTKMASSKLAWFLLLVTIAETAFFYLTNKGSDFGVFYYAAQMIRQGAGHRLYDLAAQTEYQIRYHRTPTLRFVYPPATLLPFLPLCWLPMWAGFGIWTAANLFILAKTVRRLNDHFSAAKGDWPVLLSLAFYPVADCLSNGQVSIIALALITAAFFRWRQGRLFAAGVLIGLITFKFQLIVGFMAIVVLRREWRVLAGFVVGTIPLLVISTLLVGWREMAAYPAFIKSLALHAGVGEYPRAMANIRGLLYVLLRHDPAVWLVIGLSAIVLIWSTLGWKEIDRGFSIAIIASLLIGYHTYPQDLTLLLIPIALLVRDVAERYRMLIIIIATVLPQILMVANSFSLMAIALIALAIRVRYSDPSVASASLASPSTSPRVPIERD